MSIQSACQRSVPAWNGLAMGQHLNGIEDFVVGVSGANKGDSVAVINDCEGILSQRLKHMGSRVLMAEGSPFFATGSLPMASVSLDIVVADMVIHHMRFPTHAIAEMKRVLKSGGRLVMTDWVKYDDARLREARNHLWMGFYTSDIRHWFHNAGFSNIIVNPVPYHMLGLDMKRLKDGVGAGVFLATGTA